jgi:hypothetical protein
MANFYTGAFMSKQSNQVFRRPHAVAQACGLSLLGLWFGAAQAAQDCAPARQTSVYTATPTGPVKGGGSPLALTPCASYTGLGTAEISVAVDDDGTVVMAPVHSSAGTIEIAKSSDNGVTWSTVQPKLANGKPHTRIQPYMKRDPLTGRLFFHTGRSSIAQLSVKTGFDMSYSDDAGATWTPTAVEVGSIDWAKVLPGAPVNGLRSDGYPNNLYLSTPTPISTPAFIANPKEQVVMKSEDGGKTWAKAGGFSLVPKVNGCPATEWSLWGDGVVTADGSIVIGGRRCANFGLAISHDEGKTWAVKNLPDASLISYKFITNVPFNPNYVMPSPLAIDSEDNLYAVWPDQQNKVRMSISRDKGETWSKSVVVSDVDVTAAIYPAITVKAPGQVAIAYYASVVSAKTKFHGFVAESTNVLDEAPVFTSVTINDRAAPLHAANFDVGYIGMFVGGDLNEIVQIQYGPNGDLFASFAKDMCPASKCVKDWDKKAKGNSKWQAVLGRVIHR